MTRSLLLFVLFVLFPVFSRAQDSLVVTPSENRIFFADGWAASQRVGDYILAPNSRGGMVIYEIDAEGHLTQAGTWSDCPGAEEFRVIGDYGILDQSDGGLRWIDLSDPLHPEIAGVLPFQEWDAGCWTLSDSMLFMLRDVDLFSYSVEFIDMSDPSSPDTVGSLSPDTRYTLVDWQEPLLVLGTRLGGVDMYDLTDLNNPQFQSHWDLPPLESGSADPEATQLVLNGNVLYITGMATLGNESWLQTVDISDPTAPVETDLIGRNDNWSFANDFSLKDSWGILMGSLGGDPTTMTVYNLNDPAHPTAEQSYAFQANTYRDWGDFVCVGVPSFEWSVLDARNLPGFTVTEPIEVEPPVAGAFPAGEGVLLQSPDFWMRYADCSQPNLPALQLLDLSLMFPVRHYRHGDLLVLGGPIFFENGGLMSYNLSHPFPASRIGQVSVGGNYRDAAIAWPYGFIEGYERLFAYRLDEVGNFTAIDTVHHSDLRNLAARDSAVVEISDSLWYLYHVVDDQLVEIGDPVPLEPQGFSGYGHLYNLGTTLLWFRSGDNEVSRIDWTDPESPVVLPGYPLPVPEGTIPADIFYAGTGNRLSGLAIEDGMDVVQGQFLMEMEDDGTLGAWSCFAVDAAVYPLVPLSDGRFVSVKPYSIGYVDVERVSTSVNGSTVQPLDFAIGQAYPNPFNATTLVPFTLRRSGRAALKVYDITGRLVATLVDRELTAGKHQVSWDGHSANGLPVASGTYIVRLEADGVSAARRITLVK